MDSMQHKLLEQKVEVMQREVSQVLNEMQVTIQLLAKTYSTALTVISQRLDTLESGASAVPQRDHTAPSGSEV